MVNGPIILGHESSGEIAAIGEGVTSLKVGDRVALEPGVPCKVTFKKLYIYSFYSFSLKELLSMHLWKIQFMS